MRTPRTAARRPFAAHQLLATRQRLATAIAVVAILGFASPGSAASYTIQAKNYQFLVPGGGSTLTVTVGSQVTWVASGDPHSVTSGTPAAADNRFPDHPASVGLLTSGDTFTTTFTTPGTYPYFCEIHPEQMSGVIKVVATATTPPTPGPTPRATPVPTPRPTPVPTPTKTPAPTAKATPAASAEPTSVTTAIPVASPTASPTASASATASVEATNSGVGSPLQATPSIGPVSPVPDGGPTNNSSAIVIAGLGLVILLALGSLAYRRSHRGS